MVSGRISPLRIDAVNLGCAGCHAGVLYDARGEPTREVWLGLPNTSLDVEGYTQDVYRSLRATLDDPARLSATAARLFPEMGALERWTLRHLLIPKARKRIAELRRGVDAPTPFSNGGPGRTNGVAALKLQLGLVGPGRAEGEVGFTSIPDLGVAAAALVAALRRLLRAAGRAALRAPHRRGGRRARARARCHRQLLHRARRWGCTRGRRNGRSPRSTR